MNPRRLVHGLLLLGSLTPVLAAAMLPPLPAPQRVTAPGPQTDAPYAPVAVLPGGVVIPLYPPDSPYLKAGIIVEPEVYQMWGAGLVGAVTRIHNPSKDVTASLDRQPRTLRPPGPPAAPGPVPAKTPS